MGGFIPPGAYVVRRSDSTALTVSAITTLVALAGFGYIKNRFMDAPQVRSAIQTVLIIRPAAVAFMIALGNFLMAVPYQACIRSRSFS